MDNKPSWKTAPKWARYLAADYSGVWYWFSHKPRLAGDGGWIAARGKMRQATAEFDYANSLEKRPEEPRQ